MFGGAIPSARMAHCQWIPTMVTKTRQGKTLFQDVGSENLKELRNPCRLIWWFERPCGVQWRLPGGRKWPHHTDLWVTWAQQAQPHPQKMITDLVCPVCQTQTEAEEVGSKTSSDMTQEMPLQASFNLNQRSTFHLKLRSSTATHEQWLAAPPLADDGRKWLFLLNGKWLLLGEHNSSLGGTQFWIAKIYEITIFDCSSPLSDTFIFFKTMKSPL